MLPTAITSTPPMDSLSVRCSSRLASTFESTLRPIGDQSGSSSGTSSTLVTSTTRLKGTPMRMKSAKR
jgi:hypothetical protein